MTKSLIIGTGTYIPERIKKNDDFLDQVFYKSDKVPVEQNNKATIRNFEKITGIRERLYADGIKCASEMATSAAKMAIENAGVSPESIDYIIMAHNYGDRKGGMKSGDYVPSLASRIKHHLNIKNPQCIPYDLIFGCPGWLQGLIQADCYIKSGLASCCLVVGAETLSRIIDPYDRDSMIFSDGAGACVLKAGTEEDGAGIMEHAVRSDTMDEYNYIYTGSSFAAPDADARFIKMNGHKVYIYALTYVPLSMKECLDKSGFGIHDLKMIFVHQANEKMDAAIVKKFYELYGIKTPPDGIMPMNISWMGNSSVAIIPTLFHQVLHKEIKHFELNKGDLIMFASVGAGMNINAITYVL